MMDLTFVIDTAADIIIAAVMDLRQSPSAIHRRLFRN